MRQVISHCRERIISLTRCRIGIRTHHAGQRLALSLLNLAVQDAAEGGGVDVGAG